MAELTISFRLRFAVALAVAIGLLLSLAAYDAAADHRDRGSSRTAEYIVQMERGVPVSYGKKLVRRYDGRVTSSELDVINGFGAELSERAARKLERTRGVLAVTPNSATAETPEEDEEPTSGGYECPTTDATGRTVRWPTAGEDVSPLAALRRMAQPFHFATNVDDAWERATGRGVGVAVIDTGIAGDMPDFTTRRRSRVVASAVTNPCATDAEDHYGHGTHVAGLIAGNSLNVDGGRDDDDDDDEGDDDDDDRDSGRGRLKGRYVGVAPRAHLVSVKVADDDGGATVLDVIHGIQFAVDHKDRFGIRVVNLSLSSSEPESYLTDPLNAAVEAAWFSGLVVVAAAGNDGTAAGSVSFSPGNDPYAITAGSLDDNGTRRTRDDVLAPWSSRGVTSDGFAKPDVLAAGVNLVAPLAPGSDFEDLCPDCKVSRNYFRLSGTSMSTAVVSGVAALMLEENPGWTPDRVKGALLSTLREVPGAGGAIDAEAALDGSGTANQGLTPNGLIDPASGLIDWTRASFRRASFRDAEGSPHEASWTRASFRCDCGYTDSGAIDPSRVSFRRVSFRRNVDFTP